MSAKQRGLGRGLGALIGDFQEEPESGAVTKLPLQKVEPNPDQPRRTFDEEELQALADSIAAHGILQPLAVRASGGGFYQIIAKCPSLCSRPTTAPLWSWPLWRTCSGRTSIPWRRPRAISA